jgi:hypothetical protein
MTEHEAKETLETLNIEEASDTWAIITVLLIIALAAVAVNILK